MDDDWKGERKKSAGVDWDLDHEVAIAATKLRLSSFQQSRQGFGK